MAEEKPKYKDFIEHEPEIVKFLDPKDTELANKHIRIIKALREKHMTVKEIHDLYIDQDTNKHTYTIKTIYRYLEKLEELNLIIVSGHRLTKGNRLPEKLYARTANIFFKSQEEKTTPEALEKRKDMIKKIYGILSEVEDSPIIDFQAFEEIISMKLDLESKYVREVIEKVPDNKKLSKIFIGSDIGSVNYLNEFAADIILMIKHPELMEKIQKIYKK
ncbi:MAG: hypothetical protein ACTSP5_02840 [Candidatus Heimdallarchaeota archaeon]